jgi:hypothetical protein
VQEASRVSPAEGSSYKGSPAEEGLNVAGMSSHMVLSL